MSVHFLKMYIWNLPSASDSSIQNVSSRFSYLYRRNQFKYYTRRSAVIWFNFWLYLWGKYKGSGSLKWSVCQWRCLSLIPVTHTNWHQSAETQQKTNTFHPVDVHFFSPVYMKNIFGQFHAKNVVVLKYFCVTLLYQWLIAITRNNMHVIELGSFPLSLSRQANQLLPARRFILSRQT